MSDAGLPSGGFRAVLFDFSGTLAYMEEHDGWFADMDLDDAMQATAMDRLKAPTGDVDHHAWDSRDLNAATHRQVYLHVLRGIGLPDEHAESLYRRSIDPAEWRLYPDTVPVLKTLRNRGIRTAVISNIAWDIRPVFTAVATGPDEYVLSFEVGVAKPDRRIFEVALGRLGVPAAQAVMIGDSVENDGAASDLGCAFVHVEQLPVAERPDGLVDALRSVGVDL